MGHTPGIYDTWEECKAQVDGFSGAKYKGFATQAEALQFLESNASAAPRPQQANTRSTALKRKREEDDDEEEEQTSPQKPQTRRQTKLITSPFFSTPSSSSSSSSGAEPREKKRSRTVPSQPTSGRNTTLQKFFEDNNLQARKWVDKDWIVANWK